MEGQQPSLYTNYFQLLKFIKTLDFKELNTKTITFTDNIINTINKINNTKTTEILNKIFHKLAGSISKDIKITNINDPYFNKLKYINTFFSNIYILTIDRLKIRYDRTVSLLNKNGIFNFEKFIGYDGKIDKKSRKEYNLYLKKRMSPEEFAIKQRGLKTIGSFCILKGFKDMILDAKKKNYESILILQDDLIFHKNFINNFQYLKTLYADFTEIYNSDNSNNSNNLNNIKWKLLYFGASQHIFPNDYNHTKKYLFYNPQGTADGAFAVGIHNSVFDEILSEINKFNISVDTGALRHIQRKYPNDCYVFTENIIIADIRISDLRNERSFDGIGKRFGWNIDNYDLPEIIDGII